jgi:hypothetical protein
MTPTSAARAKYLKYQNLIWLPLLSAGAFWAALTLTSSFCLGLLALLLVNIPFAGGHFGADLVDGVFSDVPAAAFFMFACTRPGGWLRARRLGYIALAGLSVRHHDARQGPGAVRIHRRRPGAAVLLPAAALCRFAPCCAIG